MRKITRCTSGFTLIEILVVVLIIAVLATIAVSAYQKAVLKSRFSSLMPLAKTLAQGNEDYYLRNGQYADDVSKLDIKATGNNKTQITLGNEDQHKYVLLTRDDMNNQLRMYQQKSLNFPGETHCEALIDDSLANWLCKDGLHGTSVGNKYGYTVYSLDENTTGILARIYTNVNDVYLDGQDQCNATVGSRYKCYNIQATNGATCNGEWDFPCQSGTFSNQSTCNGGGYMGCKGGSFDGGSICNAEKGYWSSCSGANFSNQSFCVGGNADRYNCGGSHFTKGSACYANATTACIGSTYDTTSFCAGDFCPAGSPKGVLNEATKTYERQGWNGGCCNASYVDGGVCPAGIQACS